MSFACPVRDQRLALEHIARIGDLGRDLETVDAVLGGAAAFAEGHFAPLDRIGDTVGARFTAGAVTMPAGFKAAYAAFVEGGWMSLAAPPEHGGQGLPLSLAAALMEDLQAANTGFAMLPVLSLGAVEALAAHGSDELKNAYLGKIVSGQWPATMNLTEPQAGSDVGALKTRAEPNSDGSWRIAGTKIFITYGEHDLTDQIIHLVLARTPGAPAGTRGISLFLVPKILPDGRPNDLRCVSIEHKMGIHASPTCVMSYGEGFDEGGGAIGWLVGAEHAGMKAMFTMMNNARLHVGLQGVGIAERATQRAVAFALDRRQGSRGGVPAAIADHPDVRRMLLRMRALTLGARALTYAGFAALDHRETDRAAVLTPLAKAWATDVGCEVASLGIQVHGGMGFIEETGAAQHLRDARIAPIYEGTNGIQAADLVTRKLTLGNGAALDDLMADIRAEAADPRLVALTDAVEVLTGTMRGAPPDDRLAGSYAYLTMLSVLVAGWLLERLDRVLAADTDEFSAARRSANAFFLETIVPEALGLGGAAAQGAELLYRAPAEALA